MILHHNSWALTEREIALVETSAKTTAPTGSPKSPIAKRTILKLKSAGGIKKGLALPAPFLYLETESICFSVVLTLRQQPASEQE